MLVYIGNDVRHYERYVYGLRDYIFGTDGYSQRMYEDLVNGYSMFGIQRENVSAMHAYLTDENGFWDDVANQRFNIMKGWHTHEVRPIAVFSFRMRLGTFLRLIFAQRRVVILRI